MERRRALLLAAAVSLGVGVVIVSLGATGVVSFLGFTPRHAGAEGTPATKTQHGARVVTRNRDIYDRFIVSVPTGASGSGARGSSAQSAVPAPGPQLVTVAEPAPVGTRPTPVPHSTTAPPPRSERDAPPTATTVTTSPTTTTTTTPAPTTTTTVCRRWSCGGGGTPPTTDD